MADPAPVVDAATSAFAGTKQTLGDHAVPPLAPALLDRYFAFVGLDRPSERSLPALAELQRAHLQTIPFENLDALLGRPLSLGPEAIAEKLLSGSRGGYCFEHNLLLASVLVALGYEVDLLGARVLVGASELLPRTHLALRVCVGGDEMLCDVGFGRTALRGPLLMRTRVEQTLDRDRFRLVDVGGELLLELAVSGERWEPQYLIDLRPQYIVDCVLGNHYVATHPKSMMKQQLRVLKPTATGKRSIAGTRFVVAEVDRQVDRQITLADVEAILSDEFDITLPGPLPYLDT